MYNMHMNQQLLAKRRIVIHHTHLLDENVLDVFKQNDIVFFDDCLFSQYIFLKKNIDFFLKKNIDCILSFSSGLYSSEECKYQIYAIESNVLHNSCNQKIKTIEDADKLRDILPELNGFMKISQIKDLLKYKNIHLALHGCCHLHLHEIKNPIEKIKIFIKDLDDGIKQLNKFELSTDIYVYPYVYSFQMSDRALQNAQMKIVVGSTIFRTAIEDMIQNEVAAKCYS